MKNTSSRKLRPQTALAHLTDAEREQIADWTRSLTYTQVIQRVAKPRDQGGFDTQISTSVLQRLRERTETLNQINDLLDDKQNLTELLAAQNGDPVPWSEATHQLVQRAAFKLALLPDHTPARLVSLMRIADHPRRISMDEHRKQIADRTLKLREDLFALRKSQHDLSYSRADFYSSDASNYDEPINGVPNQANQLPPPTYPPFSSLPPEIRERNRLHAEKLLGGRIVIDSSGFLVKAIELPDEDTTHTGELSAPLNSESSVCDSTRTPSASAPFLNDGSSSGSPTSSSRHAINHSDAIQPSPTDHTVLPGSSADHGNHPPVIASISASPAASPSNLTSPPIAPADPELLAATVHTYTLRRAQEYVAHNQRYTPWPYKHLPPEFITQFRHCPCGNSTPCPIHESDEFGRFPDIFWKLSPFNLDYAACLRERNLPYRTPTECLP